MNALSYYCVSPDECGALDHEDQKRDDDDDDAELFAPSPELDALFDDERMESEYLAELTEEIQDIAMMSDARESDAFLTGLLIGGLCHV